MLDHKGPGAITRIWITSLDQIPILRFYFDGSEEAQFSIPAYDLTQIGIEGAGQGFVMPHTSYSEGGVGGSTSYFPIPYAKSCKITVEIPKDIDKNPRYYQINYRSYEKNAKLETFSKEKGVTIVDSIEEYDYGKFVHIMDPEGNKIELWEPVDSVFTQMGGPTTK